MEALKSCPFCGAIDVVVRTDKHLGGKSEWYGYCNACGASGPEEYTEAAAARAWNTRADVAQVEHRGKVR